MELHNGTSTLPGAPTYYLFAGGQRVAALEAGEFTYYSQDHLGGTALATDDSGTVTQLYDYYPYGSELINSRPTGADVPSEHSFTDKELDTDLGLYYFEARWYDSEIGRFSGQDPAQLDNLVESHFTMTNDIEEFLAKNKIFEPQMLNFYSYARNNPILYIDPDGENPLLGIAVRVAILFFGDIPSAGDPDDFVSPVSTTDHTDGEIGNNIDDAIYNSMRGTLPWQIKFILGTYELVFITAFGDEKNITQNESSGNYTYTVQEGDTMYDLFGEDYQSVADYNGIENPDNISVGQEIQIPVESD